MPIGRSRYAYRFAAGQESLSTVSPRVSRKVATECLTYARTSGTCVHQVRAYTWYARTLNTYSFVMQVPQNAAFQA